MVQSWKKEKKTNLSSPVQFIPVLNLHRPKSTTSSPVSQNNPTLVGLIQALTCTLAAVHMDDIER